LKQRQLGGTPRKGNANLLSNQKGGNLWPPPSRNEAGSSTRESYVSRWGQRFLVECCRGSFLGCIAKRYVFEKLAVHCEMTSGMAPERTLMAYVEATTARAIDHRSRRHPRRHLAVDRQLLKDVSLWGHRHPAMRRGVVRASASTGRNAAQRKCQPPLEPERRKSIQPRKLPLQHSPDVISQWTASFSKTYLFGATAIPQ
jgi:hypothetical protein